MIIIERLRLQKVVASKHSGQSAGPNKQNQRLVILIRKNIRIRFAMGFPTTSLKWYTEVIIS